MDHGTILLDSPNPAEGIDRYYGLAKLKQQTSGNGEAEILGVDLIVNDQRVDVIEPSIPHGSTIEAAIKLRINSGRPGALMNVVIFDAAMTPIITMPTYDADGKLNLLPVGTLNIRMSLGMVELTSGKYSIGIGVADSTTNAVLTRVQGLCPFRVISDKAHWGVVVRHVVPERIDVVSTSYESRVEGHV